jgi:hypothetical protein
MTESSTATRSTTWQRLDATGKLVASDRPHDSRVVFLDGWHRLEDGELVPARRRDC